MTHAAFVQCPQCLQNFVNMKALQIHCLITSDPKHSNRLVEELPLVQKLLPRDGVTTHGAAAESESVSKLTATTRASMVNQYNTRVSCAKCRQLIDKDEAMLWNYRYECKNIIDCNGRRNSAASTALIHVPGAVQQQAPRPTAAEESEAIRQELHASMNVSNS